MVSGNGPFRNAEESAVTLSGRYRKTDPDLFRLRKHRLCQHRLMPAVERRHLDLAAIGAADSGSLAPAAAKSMYWSSSWSPMTRPRLGANMGVSG